MDMMLLNGSCNNGYARPVSKRGRGGAAQDCRKIQTLAEQERGAAALLGVARGAAQAMGHAGGALGRHSRDTPRVSLGAFSELSDESILWGCMDG